MASEISNKTLSKAQEAKIKQIKADGGTVEITKCQHCGKILVRDISIEQEAGDLCQHLRQDLGYTTESLMAHRASLTAQEVPEGYIKVAQLHKICEKAGIPVNRMVRAIGKDRGLTAPVDPRLQPVYVGNARWVDGWASTKEGLALIASCGATGSAAPTKEKGAKSPLAKVIADAVPTAS